MWKLINYLQFLLIAIWTAFSASLGMLTMFLTRSRKATMWFTSSFWAPVINFISGARVSVKGRENVDASVPKIYVANHSSLMDIPLLSASMPVDLYYVAKKELKKVPFLGWFVTAVGMIFIDRGNRQKAMQSLKEAGDIIKSGRNVISFPEGTRSEDGSIRLFRRGTFIMAATNEIEVVPIAIKGAFNILPARKMRMRPGKVQVNIGLPMAAKTEDLDNIEDLAAPCPG